MLQVTRTYNTASIPVWQGTAKDIQLAQGGFNLTIPSGAVAGQILPAGTPIVFDEATRQATYTAVGTLYSAATNSTTTYNLNKGSGLKVGDYLALAGTGAQAYAITAIDTSNANYDVYTVGTTLGVAASAGAGLYASTATGASASAYPTGVNGLSYDDVVIGAGQTISVVIRGTCYARRLPAYSAALAALTGLKNIIFSQSK
jgi:hypothetical protein